MLNRRDVPPRSWKEARLKAFRVTVRLPWAVAFLVLFGACSSAPAPRSTGGAQPSAVASSESQTVSVSSEVATVFVYRPKAFFGWALNPTVMLDGEDFVNVRNGRFFKAKFRPSKHVFKMDDGASGAELDLQGGKSYYLKVEIVPGVWKGGGKMTYVAPEQGGLEVQGLKYVDAKEIDDPAFR
jgi:hypothetical protein